MRRTDVALYLCYFLIIAFFIGPVLWVVSLSLKLPGEIFAYPPRLIPNRLAVENYVTVWTRSHISLFMFNSFKIVALTVIGCLTVSIPAAFAFSRFRFKGKREAMFGILAFQMISPIIILIPLYRYLSALNLLDTHLGLVMIYIAVQTPFTVWLLKGFFDSIPQSLDDAAMVDGCLRIQALYLIILPISVPGVVAATVFIAIQSWSQFIIPFIVLSNLKLLPISVGIFHFQSTQAEISTHFLAAASILGMLPAILIFVVLQRFIVQFLIAGAVKG